MSLQANINQNAAQVNFSALIAGASPAILQPQVLQPGYAYLAGYLNMIGLKSGQYVLYDSTDVDQSFYGLTYDSWENINSFVASQNPFTFTGNTSTARGNDGQTFIQNITGTTASSTTITATSINTNLLVIGASVTGAGIPSGTTIATIASASSFTISNAATTSVTNNPLVITTSAITVGNIAGNNGVDPSIAMTVITGITSTSNLLVGALISGTGIPAQSTILEILSSTAILVANNATATNSGVTLTSYLTSADNMLIDIATTQNATTQWRYNYMVGVNSGQTDIDALIAGGGAQLLTLPNGQIGIDVVTFNFMGAA